MRRNGLWMLLALTAVLLLAVGVARGDGASESGGRAAESVVTEWVEEELRSWFGLTMLPARLTLQTPIGGAFCEETGLTEIWLLVSGGVPPYTITVDGQQVDGSIGYVLVSCRPLETSLPPCDPLRSSHRTVRTTATDSRGVSAKTEVRIELGDPPSPVEPGAVRQGTSAGAGLRLSWTPPANTPPVCAYELQYQATAWDATSWPDSWTAISDTIAAGATEYLHSGLDPNRRYRYELRAKNNIGASYWSPAFPEAGVRPGAPALAAQTAASGSVALSWSAAPADATHWEYRRRQEGGSWSVWTAIVGASTAEHTVSGLTEDVCYQFQLRAHTAGGAGPASAIASAVAGLTPNAPRVGADGIRIMSGWYVAEGGHTYRLIGQGPIVIDVPVGMRLRFGSGALTSRGTASVWYFDEVSGGEFGLDPYTGEDPWYYVETPEGETEPPADVVTQLEALVESIRELPLPATASDE